MDIDTAMAARFLTALTGDRTHTFQTVGEGGRGRSLNRIMHGAFEQRANALQLLNLKGAGVFVMVNRGDGYGRKADNVTAARALFVDLDGAPLEPVLAGPIPPRIVVESSPGKWHAYWPVADLPLERFTDAQKVLALRFDGDPKVSDRPRAMRLPGFLHNKGAPFQTRLVECADNPLTWREMVEAFGLTDRLTLPATIPEGARNETLFRLALAAARKGVPESEQVKKAHAVNAKRCDPSLPAAEVAEIVASAYRRPAQGVTAIPLAVMDGEAYRAIGDGARTLLLLAYRKADAYNGTFPLLWSECRPWIGREKTFKAYRKELADVGLIVPVIAAEPAQPRKGRGPKPTFYRLAIGAKSAPYSLPQIGAKTAPPEALQALSSDALQAVDLESAPSSNRHAA